MTRRRQFAAVLADIRGILADVTREDRVHALFQAAREVARFDDDLTRDVSKVRELIDVGRTARETTGPGQAIFEEDLMRAMHSIAWQCCRALDVTGEGRHVGVVAVDDLDADLRETVDVVAALRDHALDSIRFTPRPRDSFAGARRGLAFEILGVVGRLFDLPEALDLARQALRRNRNQEVRGTIAFLQEYFKVREARTMPGDIRAALLTVVDKTDRRSVAAGALQALIDAGVMCEGAALNRIDDWKDEHYR